ncbi:hypothetical protein DWB84_12515 [Saccharophagus sp. K07]|jgi:hypothetical protein|uniref:metal-dependent hydrolase n=1 Tax=Saccharophagus sp. K07 TaxID=2283636 RepID=UPI00165238C9|nr:metal-dependent hydrolase [Saccharophagus sp. K07]MBC6906286.1 hypothetical protein [Saccharophagus sp. K07]
MANFKTHLQVASISSGLASTLFYSSGHLLAEEAFLCWIMGTFGGLLPDIDSDNSHSLGILFGAFSVTACGFTAVAWIDAWPLIWVWAACTMVFIAVQFGVRYVFARFTRHRGIFHSLLACLLFMFITAIGAAFLGAGGTMSWFLALFLGFGYCIHLLLDEIFAVDFMNVAMKRSFGSAFKLFDYRNITTSGIMAVAVIALYFLTPSYAEFVAILFDKDTYAGLATGMDW